MLAKLDNLEGGTNLVLADSPTFKKKEQTMMGTWQQTEGSLYRAFSFKDFSEAFAFMTRMALLAEQQNHHPTWKNTWNKVEIWLSTHDAGNQVTDKDRKLAAAIDELL